MLACGETKAPRKQGTFPQPHSFLVVNQACLFMQNWSCLPPPGTCRAREDRTTQCGAVSATGTGAVSATAWLCRRKGSRGKHGCGFRGGPASISQRAFPVHLWQPAVQKTYFLPLLAKAGRQGRLTPFMEKLRLVTVWIRVIIYKSIISSTLADRSFSALQVWQVGGVQAKQVAEDSVGMWDLATGNGESVY